MTDKASPPWSRHSVSCREIYEFMTGDLAKVMVCGEQSRFLLSVPRRRLIRMELPKGDVSDCRRFLTAAAEKPSLMAGLNSWGSQIIGAR